MTETGARTSRTEDHVRLDTREQPKETIGGDLNKTDDAPQKPRRSNRKKEQMDRNTVHTCICSCTSGATQ